MSCKEKQGAFRKRRPQMEFHSERLPGRMINPGRESGGLSTVSHFNDHGNRFDNRLLLGRRSTTSLSAAENHLWS